MAMATLIGTTASVAEASETAESIQTGMATSIAATIGDGAVIPAIAATVVSVESDVILRRLEFGQISTPRRLL